MKRYYVYFDGKLVATYGLLIYAISFAERGTVNHLTVLVTEGLNGKVVWLRSR